VAEKLENKKPNACLVDDWDLLRIKMTPEIKKEEVYVVRDQDQIIGYFQTQKEAETMVKETKNLSNSS